jgi:hypothetical protein
MTDVSNNQSMIEEYKIEEIRRNIGTDMDTF